MTKSRRSQVDDLILAVGIGGLSALCWMVPAAAGEKEDANRLFVSAVAAWNDAGTKPGKTLEDAQKRLALVEKAASNLQDIVDDHSGADLALQLVIGEDVGPLSLERVRLAQTKARSDLASLFASCSDRAACAVNMAERIARAIPELDARKYPLLIVAAARTDSALFSEALSLSDDHNWWDGAHQEFALAQVEAGMLPEALKTAMQIADEAVRSGPLQKIVEAQANAGMFAEAHNTAHMVPVGNFDREKAIATVAIGQAKAGLFEESFATVKELGDWRDNAYAEIFLLQAEDGRPEKAIDNLRFIKNPEKQVEAFVNIAASQENFALLESVAISANDTLNEPYRTRALAVVATQQARLGMFREAVETAHSIDDPAWRSNAYEGIIETYIERSMFTEALQALDEVSEYSRDETLEKIASAQAQARLYEQALETINPISDVGFDRERALTNIATAQAEDGMFEEALAMARSMEIVHWGLSSIAVVQAKKGRFRQALETALEVEEPRDRVTTLLSIAKVIQN